MVNGARILIKSRSSQPRSASSYMIVIARCTERLLSVGPVGRQCVVDVNDLQDAGCQRNLVPPETIGVTAPVQTFVVVADYGEAHDGGISGRNRCALLDGMLLDYFHFLKRQAPRFHENRIGDSNLANVVQHPGKAKRVTLIVGQTNAFRQSDCEERKSFTVAHRVWVARFDAPGQRKDNRFRLFVDVGFQLQQRLHSRERLPACGLRLPNIVGAGITSFGIFGIVGKLRNQNHRREPFLCVFLHPGAKFEARYIWQ